MGLKDLQLNQSCSSDVDDILNSFFVPALAVAKKYRRLAGFFSSTSLAVAARGVLGLVRNGGTIELIASPKLSKADLAVLGENPLGATDLLTNKLLLELDYSKLQDRFVRDHVFALAWMLKNRRLALKVAIVQDEESVMFHEKVGILEDSDGNVVTFSGSVNETATGWLGNIEEFKVFRSWEAGEQGYVEADVRKFERFWKEKSPRVQVVPAPAAVERRLCSMAPDDIAGLDVQAHQESAKARYTLFPYQMEAVRSWVGNGMRGVFEMATGTGKTFTALGCLAEARKRYENLVTVIACPYQHLVHQWRDQIARFGMRPNLLVADSSTHWRDSLADELVDLDLGRKSNLLVLTTHSTLASHDFRSILSQKAPATSKALLIADEVHGTGAPKTREGLTDLFSLRLGLSATPRRWFDTEGTDLIEHYFGGTVFEFPLRKALTEINPLTGQTFLTPYRYLPVFVTLDQSETYDYLEKTRRFLAKWNQVKGNPDEEAALQALLFERANIVKNASAKLGRLEDLLDELGAELEFTIVYCTPQQIDSVMQIVQERRIPAHRFTMAEGTVPEARYGGLSERDAILDSFGKGFYKTLVAMKCLDEGVDVPAARTAILMASSANPREYIQRIGRVIRRSPGKQEACIYDLVVIPSFGTMPPEVRETERRVFMKEMQRFQEIVDLAINRTEALRMLFDMLNRL